MRFALHGFYRSELLLSVRRREPRFQSRDVTANPHPVTEWGFLRSYRRKTKTFFCRLRFSYSGDSRNR